MPVVGTAEEPWRAKLAQLTRLLPRAGSPTVAALIGLSAAQAVMPLATIAVTGRVVARVATGPRLGTVAAPLAVLAALFVLQQLVAPLQGVVAFRATSRIDGWVRAQAMVAAGRPAGIGLLEDQDVQDRMAVAAGKPLPFRAATPGGAAVGVVSMVARYVQGFGAALLVARFSAVLAVALAAGSLWFRRLNHRVNVAQAQAFEDHMPSYRWAGYYTGLAVEPSGAKETRIFGLADWLVRRHRAPWDRVTTSMTEVRHRTARGLTGCYLSVFPLHAVVFVSVGVAAADRRIGLGTLAVVIQAARKLVDLTQLGSDDYQIDFGAASLPAAAELQRRSREAAAAAPSGRRAATGLPREEIRFESVGFRYPGAPAPVFEGLDLVVPAGTSMALVGANGAGKTTLVKLLGRLYEPTSGRILVDGVDLRELDVAGWRDRLAVIFQDFVHYELSAADNVGLGGLSRIDDRPALVAAAARAGTLELIEGLAHGWDTVLSRAYTGGVDLSGGEWQRVALARALLAVDVGAHILALDEPTANLDVRAEADLFDRFLDITACPDGGPRLTTLLISHRFSTVRRAECICVLHQGRVAEQGSHDELVRAGGRYATMFALQAARFHG